jgi:indole-3-glycerol phosphate synthase
MILDEILAHKVAEVAARKVRMPFELIAARAAAAPRARGFRMALGGAGVSVIAEVKRASPTKGDLRRDLDAPATAACYVEAGAAAISVLTDERYFRGSDADLNAVRDRVGVPLLRKDFVVEPYQVYEARALGADAVLLIVRALPANELVELMEVARSLGMDALVEVHTPQEAAIALDAGATLVGVNNRDLTRMSVDLGTTARLRPLVPAGITVVSESGIRTPGDVGALAAAGVDGVLVGEALVTADDAGRLLREMLAAGRQVGGGRPEARRATA